MKPQTNLAICLVLLAIFFAGHVTFTQNLLRDVHNKLTMSQLTIPNFSDIGVISARKQAFFDYLSPFITAENSKIRAQRDFISQQNMQSPSSKIQQLAIQYRLPANTANVKQSLLKRIDVLPSSLVLAQAAIESGWGTSRFAKQGNNFFGQWCFTKGCGLIPSKRSNGSHHEVKRFNSPAESIASYMHNLNSHPAYRQLRENRTVQRGNSDLLNGCFLAEGLLEYSERKVDYVNSLKQLIRINDLEDKNSSYCQPPAEVGLKNQAKQAHILSLQESH